MQHFNHTLDLETAGEESEFALQPYRAMCTPPRAWITDMAVAELSTKECVVHKDNFQPVLDSLAGKRVISWNTGFDVAWLIATKHDVTKIQWFDGLLLWKWVLNSQRTDSGAWSWSLAAAVQYYAKYLPGAESYIEMKKNAPPAGENPEYWEQRAKLDTIYTVMLGNILWEKLTDRQRTTATIEAMNILPVARSWLLGINLNMDRVVEAAPAVTQEMEEIEYRLGLHNNQHDVGVFEHNLWTPSKVLRSPMKLREVLYETWKLPVEFRTETGKPSTNKAALTYLADRSKLCLEILRWRTLNTELTKFIQAFSKSVTYLNMGNKSYPSPRLFATKTGRMTYSSKTLAEVRT